jgi:proteic killer suppression protein
VKAFSGIERSARLKLDRLEAAAVAKDLAALPGNRFEALAGDRKGQYSIRINGGPSKVEIVHYHSGGIMAIIAIHPGEHLQRCSR